MKFNHKYVFLAVEVLLAKSKFNKHILQPGAHFTYTHYLIIRECRKSQIYGASEPVLSFTTYTGKGFVLVPADSGL